ncbi:MAG: PA2169 family four-helix-bundle protein [Chitinophagaceae bacterium]
MKNEEVLNDLILINNDRTEGYSKAAKQTEDNDLQSLFTEMSSQSAEYATELKQHLKLDEEDPGKDTTFKGKIYRSWMDVKATFGGDDRKGILSSCEFGEDAAQKAYKSALGEDEITSEVRGLIENQQRLLKDAHDKVKMMRDATPA